MKKLITLSLLFLIMPALFWYGYMVGVKGFTLSDESSDWADFGSYYGGIVSPILSLISIIFLYITIDQANKNNSNQLNITLKQDRRGHLINLLNSYNQFLNESINEISINFNLRLGSLPLYEGDETLISHPNRTLKSALIDFQSYISKTKKFHPLYISYIQFISANAEYCLIRSLEHALKIKDTIEFEESLDLIETLADHHATIGFLELDFRLSINNKTKSPLLEKLVEINKRSKYLEVWSKKYLTIAPIIDRED